MEQSMEEIWGLLENMWPEQKHKHLLKFVFFAIVCTFIIMASVCYEPTGFEQ